MKRLLCILTTLLLLVSFANAQQVSPESDSTVVAPVKNLNYARVMTDVGKSITYVGCGFAYVGGAYLAMIKFDKRLEPAQVFGGIFLSIAAIGYGSIIGAAGLLAWIPGEIILSSNDSAPTRFLDDKAKRFEIMLNLSYFDALTAESVLGYNFSRHFFVGAGASYSYHFTRTESTHDYLPVFMRSRVTLGSHLVRPYFDFDLGVDALDGSFYYSTGMGAKWRLSSKQNFITLGTYMNACENTSDIQIKLGYIF